MAMLMFSTAKEGNPALKGLNQKPSWVCQLVSFIFSTTRCCSNWEREEKS